MITREKRMNRAKLAKLRGMRCRLHRCLDCRDSRCRWARLPKKGVQDIAAPDLLSAFLPGMPQRVVENV